MHRPAITRACITLIRRLINRGRYLSKRDQLYRSLSIVRLKKVAIKSELLLALMYDALNDQWRVYDDVVMDLCFMLIVPQLALKYIRMRKVLNAPIT